MDCSKSWSKRWAVNLSCVLSAFESTSVVSIAKFGFCSEKLSASDDVQHQIEQTHLQESKILTQQMMHRYEEQTITNVVDVSYNVVVATGLDIDVWRTSRYTATDEIVSEDNAVQESHTVSPLLWGRRCVASQNRGGSPVTTQLPSRPSTSL